ncbi:MAG TPA: hypothetical protein VMS21_11070 [Methylomirabilota bacterium]|nr:hypothetical protein [Methylomirabilota bacterium]
MNLEDFIQTGQRPPELRFLVIGGYAVGAHGHVRATFDVDFLARCADRDAWRERLTSAGLIVFQETRAFAQFTQPEGGDGLDLMFVDEPTFGGIWEASLEQAFGAVATRIPCLDHLLALKLHALKQSLPHRTSKDAEDVEMLVRRNGLDLRNSRYARLFLKYGNREIYDTFIRLLRDA